MKTFHVAHKLLTYFHLTLLIKIKSSLSNRIDLDALCFPGHLAQSTNNRILFSLFLFFSLHAARQMDGPRGNLKNRVGIRAPP